MQQLLFEVENVPFPTPKNYTFKFIDLFAGIGGFHLALSNLGMKCVFASEFDEAARKTYLANHEIEEQFFNTDIRSASYDLIPDHDILCAGFPCQAFSHVGKRVGLTDGSNSERGNLFYCISEILEVKKPRAFILENVRGLVNHDNGNTFKTIISSLENLNYSVSFKLLNANDFGVPQHRERIIIVAVHNSFSNKEFDFSSLINSSVCLSDILEKEHHILLPHEYTLIDSSYIKKQKSGLIFCGYRNKNIRKVGVKENSLHLSRTHKQPNRIYSTDGLHPALPSQESSGRFWIYDNGQVRKLTINECYRIMGFPENFIKINNLSINLLYSYKLV
mgnify:CR=1 FL=1